MAAAAATIPPRGPGQQIARPINTPLGSASGFFLSIYDPVDFLRGLVFALGSDSDVNILSSPNILALDNKEATIEVGNDVPTVTGSTTSTINRQHRHQHGPIPENRHSADRNAPHQFQRAGQDGADPGSQRSRRFQQGTQQLYFSDAKSRYLSGGGGRPDRGHGRSDEIQ